MASSNSFQRWMNKMLRIARAAVQSAKSTVINQSGVVSDNVESVIRKTVDEVVSGVWKGNGANNFVDELQNEVLPVVISVVTSLATLNANIDFALDRMERADQEAAGVANSLGDTFRSIYH